MGTSMTQEEFNAMLQIAIAQGIPGGIYMLRDSGEEIDAAHIGAQSASVSAVPSRSVTLSAGELQAYIDALPRLVAENLTLNVSGELASDVNLAGFYGPGSIILNGRSALTLYGTLNISRCALFLQVQSVAFDGSKKSGTYSQTLTSYSHNVVFSGCKFNGNGTGNVVAVNTTGMARLRAYSSEFRNLGIAVSAQDGSIIEVGGSGGAYEGNAKGASAYSGIILLSPRVPETLGGAANSNSAGLIVGAGGKLL